MLWILRDEDERDAIEEMASLPDRVVAIVNAAIIEARLDDALRSRLIDDSKRELLTNLFSDSRGLGSLGTKNQLAFALGIYGEDTKKDVHQLKTIRNRFAHELKAKSFEESPIVDWCKSLRLVDRFIFDSSVPASEIGWVKGMTMQIEDRSRIMGIPRMRFQATAALVMNGLHLSASAPTAKASPSF